MKDDYTIDIDQTNKGLSIITNSIIKIKYPFIKSIIINEKENELVGKSLTLVNVYIDLNDFIEQNNERLRTNLERLFRNGIMDFFDDYPTSGYLSSLVGDEDVTLNKYGYKYNEEIMEVINDYMTFLPDNMRPKYTTVSDFTEDIAEYESKIVLHEFIITFDPIRYLNYINE